MSAGYSVELAESDTRAREVLANHRVAITIMAASGLGTGAAFDPGEKGGKLVILTEPQRDIGLPARSVLRADACLTLPLDKQDMLARLESVLQSKPCVGDTPQQAVETLSFEGFTLDLAGRCLRDRCGLEVRLTRSEFALLTEFVRHPGRVLSRDQLLDAAAGRRAEPYDRSVDVLVGRLRRKIEPAPKVPRLIITVLGEGYKFAAKVAECGLSAPTSTAIPAAAPALWQSNERRQLTVLSCSLAGSAALSARLDPEDLRDLISAFHRCCSEVIVRFSGMVAPFSGERVLAYFGYPEAHEHDAEGAVRAGLALVEAVAKLDIGDGLPLHARVGIATGLVVTGGLAGAETEQALVAIGDAPDLAALVQTRAAPDTVVISASTRRLVRGLFDYRDLQAVALEGSAEPVPAWQVVRPSTAESRFQALREGTLAALVGRDEELELLLRRWRQIQSGRGRVVFIAGEPGIGKSRLVRALQDCLANHTRLSWYCSPHHQDSALYPVIAQLEHEAGFRRSDTPEERLGKFDAVVHPSIDGEARALIASLLSIPIGDRYARLNISPQLAKERTLEALVGQLAALANEQPVLAVFEDVHWMDPTTGDLMGLIVDRVRNLPVLLLIAYRPVFTPPWTNHAHSTTLVLNRLDNRQVAAIAEQVTGKRLPAEVCGQIIELSDGIPLFIEELAKNVLESGLLNEFDDEFVLRRPLPPLAIPSSLQGSLIARLDRLGRAKKVAQIGAALGREFPYDLIRLLPISCPSPSCRTHWNGSFNQNSSFPVALRRTLSISSSTPSFRMPPKKPSSATSGVSFMHVSQRCWRSASPKLWINSRGCWRSTAPRPDRSNRP
jgi:class 3 adenylate cyclase